MNTEKSLRIRRAKSLDAVNLYRLLVDEEKRAGTGVPFDEAARIAHVLTVIETGFVSVAVISGRIIGSIGALPTAPRYAKEAFLAGEWLAVLPSFSDTPVGKKLVEGLVRFADLHKFSVRFTLPYPVSKQAAKAASDNGFGISMMTYSREPGLSIDAESDAPITEAAAEPERADVGEEQFPPGF